MTLVRVINPNSNEAVTEGIRAAVTGFAVAGRIEIVCETLDEGPFGIESQMDAESVVLPLARRIGAADADAFVIACYSDPGLHLARTVTRSPVYGIQESGILTALARGERFGVIAIAEPSIRRHLRAIRQMGVESRLAGERALGVSVAESAGDAAFAALGEAGVALCDRDGADVIVLGCAGMARHRAGLEEMLGVPVIDPVQAATGMAVAGLMATR